MFSPSRTYEYIEKEGRKLPIINRIIKDVLHALYQPFWFSLVLSFFVMVAYLYSYHPINTGNGPRKLVEDWIEAFKTSSFFRRCFLLVFYTTMILFRTLFNRDMWLNPLNNVLGAWKIYSTDVDGNVIISTEGIENILLFVPFAFMYLHVTNISRVCMNRKKIGHIVRLVFLFSLGIKFSQMMFQLGTVQLSDLFFNTLGGLIGGVSYWVFDRIAFKINGK